MRGKRQIVKCKTCKDEFEARVADIKRGWGKYCSKSCKAIKQEQKTGATADFRRRRAWVEQEGWERYDKGGFE